MLRKIEWGVQNGPITKNRVLPLIALTLKNLILVREPPVNITTKQILIFGSSHRKCSVKKGVLRNFGTTPVPQTPF